MPGEQGSTILDKYRYHSKILEGDIRFELIDTRQEFDTIDIDHIEVGEAVYMAGDLIHSVSVEEGQKCAWLVFEGAEDPNYEPFCYTNIDPNKIDTSRLYKPFNSIKGIENLLKHYKLI